MSAKIKPLGSQVLIELLIDEPAAGGVYVPETARKKPTTGPVRAVGPAVRDVHRGDTVMFPQFGGTEIKMGSKTYLLLKEDTLLGIVCE